LKAVADFIRTLPDQARYLFGNRVGDFHFSRSGDYAFGHLQYAGMYQGHAQPGARSLSLLPSVGEENQNISIKILQALEIGHEAVVLVFVCLGVDHAEDRGGMNGD
jgi:hypothetical protein